MNKKLFTLYWYMLSFLISWGKKRGVHFIANVSYDPTQSDPLGMYRKITLSLVSKDRLLNIVINAERKE